MTMPAPANIAAWIAQTAILVAAALCAIRVFRLDAPAVRYFVLRALLVISLALPFVQPRIELADRGPKATALADATTTLVWTSSRPDPASGFPLSLPDAALMLAAAGAMLRFCWIAAGLCRLRRLRRAGEAVASLDDCSDLTRTVTGAATIRLVPNLGQPLTFGFRAPVILLPHSIRSQSRSIQRAVLAHELWHVRRRDWLWTVCEELLRAALWFNPAIWILLSSIQSAREEVVDELSILTTGSRRNYADALLLFAGNSRWFGVTAFARRRHLVHRLVLISKEAVMSARRVVATAALVLVCVASAGWYSVQAFPMREAQAGAPGMRALPGPLERQAGAATPENPVPRRTYQVPPDDPLANDPGSFAVVRLRLTLDAAGQVAELRPTALTLRRSNGPVVRLTNQSTEDGRIAWVQSGPSRPAADESDRLLGNLVSAAARSVQQWQYAPPFQAPLSFDAEVSFGTPPPPPPPPPAPARARGVQIPLPAPAPPATSSRPGGAQAAPAANSRPGMPLPPPPPPPPPPASQATDDDDPALRVGGPIKVPTKLKNVSAVYPQDAKDAKIQGVVIIEARIERDGTVGRAKVLRSIPMLDDAAVAAVRQWEFTPTLLNGVAVPIMITVTVNFTLQ
jgi:protein TonB